MLTTAYLRERLHYEPETGALIWLASKKRGEKRYEGQRAGGIRPKDGRRQVGIDGQKFLASRLIWQIVTGDIPPCLVDHWNGDSADDRWVNLRLATTRQNVWNMKRHSDSKSGFKGVWRLKNGRYRARVGSIHLGCFETPEAAHAAYIAAAHNAYGEFARAG